MIIVPKTKRIETELTAACDLSGHFVMEKLKVDANGTPIEASRVKVAEFDNLITNQGQNRIGTASDWLNAVQVGSGTTAPAVTDTGLAFFVAGTTTQQATSAVSQSSPPYYTTRSVTRRFAAGAATGNLSEVGIGWAATGSTLFSRALILDGSGNPTTITVLSDEVLDVTYQLRLYPPAADVSSNITVTGVGTIAVTARAANVTNQSDWGLTSSGLAASFWSARIWSGAIGAVTSQPSGSQASVAPTNSAYSNNSLQRTGSATWGLNDGNFNVQSASIFMGTSTGFGAMQFGFGTAIPKTNANVLTLNFTHAWARRTL